MKRKLSLNYLFATFLFVGYIPFAPGTWGTLAGLIFGCIFRFRPFFIKLLLIAATFITGVLVAGRIEKKDNIEDPGFIVIDEVVGIWLAMMFIPVELRYDISQLVIAFFGFRFFDILKIPPIKNCEKIAGGMGVMMDDVVAGIFTGIVILIVNLF